MRDFVSVLRDFIVSDEVDGTVGDTGLVADVLVLSQVSQLFHTDDAFHDEVVLLVLLILNTVSEEDD